MKAVTTAPFNNLLKRLRALTEINSHTETNILIAKYYGFEDYLKEFMKIKQIQKRHDGLSIEETSLRYQTSLKMLSEIEKSQGREVRQQINSCL